MEKELYNRERRMGIQREGRRRSSKFGRDLAKENKFYGGKFWEIYPNDLKT